MGYDAFSSKSANQRRYTLPCCNRCYTTLVVVAAAVIAAVIADTANFAAQTLATAAVCCFFAE